MWVSSGTCPCWHYKTVTVLPGDAVVGDESGLLFFPPQLADEVIKGWVEDTVYIEDFKREMISGDGNTAHATSIQS